MVIMLLQDKLILDIMIGHGKSSENKNYVSSEIQEDKSNLNFSFF